MRTLFRLALICIFPPVIFLFILIAIIKISQANAAAAYAADMAAYSADQSSYAVAEAEAAHMAAEEAACDAAADCMI